MLGTARVPEGTPVPVTATWVGVFPPFFIANCAYLEKSAQNKFTDRCIIIEWTPG